MLTTLIKAVVMREMELWRDKVQSFLKYTTFSIMLSVDPTSHTRQDSNICETFYLTLRHPHNAFLDGTF